MFPSADAFAQNFVKDKCLTIIDDVDKLDSVEDGFIRHQGVGFRGGAQPFSTPPGGVAFLRRGGQPLLAAGNSWDCSPFLRRIGRNAVTSRSSTTCKTPLAPATWFLTSP